MSSKTDGNLTKLYAAARLGHWQYVVYVCEWMLCRDPHNIEIWQLFRDALINIGDQGTSRKALAFLHLGLHKLTKNPKWLIRGLRHNFTSKSIYAYLEKLADQELALFIAETIYLCRGYQMLDGVHFCEKLLELGKVEQVMKVGEKMLKEIGEYAEILAVLQTASIMQLNSKDRAQASA